MILNKLYENRGYNKDEFKLLIELFFKIKKIRYSTHQINLFVVYLTTVNENPLLPNFHKFLTVTEIIHNVIAPEMELYLEIIKFYKDNQFIKYTWNDVKYKDLF